jgi:hypothetical protein
MGLWYDGNEYIRGVGPPDERGRGRFTHRKTFYIYRFDSPPPLLENHYCTPIDKNRITMAPKVLFILTSHDKFANGKPTGWWLVRPYSGPSLSPFNYLISLQSPQTKQSN